MDNDDKVKKEPKETKPKEAKPRKPRVSKAKAAVSEVVEEVKELLVRTKSLFLPENALKEEQKPAVYSLDKEMITARKTKDYFLLASVVVFLLLLVIVAYFLHYSIEKKNRQVDVQISDFESFNISELLNSSRKLQEELQQAQAELSVLENERNDSVQYIEDDIRSEKRLVLMKGLSMERQKREISRIDSEFSARKSEIYARYSSQIAEKKKEIAALSDRVNKQKNLLAASGQGDNLLLNNYQKVHELELQKQRNYYENRIRLIEARQNRELTDIKNYYEKVSDVLVLKYNPVFEDPAVLTILKSPMDTSLPVNLRDYQNVLQTESIFSSVEFSRLRNKISSRTTLVSNMLAIPYTNSIPLTLNQINFLSNSIINDYEKIWGSLAISVSSKNELIENYQFALNQLLKERRESVGYVIDPRDRQKVVVYIDNIYKIRSGETAYVFRNDNEYIAKVKLYPGHDKVSAEVVEMNEGNQIRAFDKILVHYIKPAVPAPAPQPASIEPAPETTPQAPAP